MSAEVCDAPFDFFLRVVTRCGRPQGHTGPHHPLPFHYDDLKETK